MAKDPRDPGAVRDFHRQFHAAAVCCHLCGDNLRRSCGIAINTESYGGRAVVAVTIWLGNHAAVDHPQVGVDEDTGEPVRQRVRVAGKRCTTVQPPDGVGFRELATTLAHPDGVWAHHSDAEAPAWVACTDPDLAQRLGALFGCPVRDPEV